jgi:hypothetical protein
MAPAYAGDDGAKQTVTLPEMEGRCGKGTSIPPSGDLPAQDGCGQKTPRVLAREPGGGE